MAISHPTLSPRLQLAKAVRERFVTEIGRAMAEVATAVMDRLTVLMDEPSNARENQLRRDAWMAYKKASPVWQELTIKVWRDCLEPTKEKRSTKKEADGLELVGAEVVENKILASRMVMAVVEKVNAQLDDLRIRIRFLEGSEELDGHDIFRPEVLILLMVEQ